MKPLCKENLFYVLLSLVILDIWAKMKINDKERCKCTQHDCVKWFCIVWTVVRFLKYSSLVNDETYLECCVVGYELISFNGFLLLLICSKICPFYEDINAAQIIPMFGPYDHRRATPTITWDNRLCCLFQRTVPCNRLHGSRIL